MRANRVWLLVVALVASALFGGLVTQEAEAQTYTVDILGLQRSFIEFGLGRTLEQGQDIILLGVLTVLGPRTATDTVTVTVLSPDSNVPTNAVDIPVPLGTPIGTDLPFAIQQLTLVAGNFTVVVVSALEGAVGPTLTFPASNYGVTVGISAVTGQVGTPFLVNTTIDVGAMSEIRSRIDIEYVLDGVPLRQSHFVVLFGEIQAIINEDLTFTVFGFPQTPDQMTWRTTQAFTLSPGNHSLTVRVIDQSVNNLVASETFSIQVTDQIAGIETMIDQVALELGDRITELTGQVEDANSRAASAELATATVSLLAIVAFVALGAAVVALLILFGVLKFGRFKRGPEQPGEPEE